LCLVLCIQGTAEGQNRLVKIIGFEMKVLVALVTDYVDWLGDCVDALYRLTIYMFRLASSWRFNRVGFHALLCVLPDHSTHDICKWIKKKIDYSVRNDKVTA